MLEAYRGKVVDNKCGQIFSVGVNAIMKTDSIGVITNAAIKTALIDQTSIFFKNKEFYLFVFFLYQDVPAQTKFTSKNIADDRIITKN